MLVKQKKKGQAMDDVRQLGDRITSALDRIRRGLEAQAKSDAAGEGLYDALQEERAKNKTLITQIERYKDDQDAQMAQLNDKLAQTEAQLQSMDDQLQRLRASTDQLRQSNAQLHEGVTGASINAALAAEVEALKALRAAETAEIDAILAELKPLIEEASRAAN
jgi:chromosome segregation ATPase